MRSTTTLLTAAATLLASTAQARIVGFYAPQNAAPNADVKIEIFTEGYPQTINDVAISFGLTPLESLFMGSLGTYVSTKALGPDFSNVDGNITHIIHIPATFPVGPAVLQASHFSLTGASSTPATEIYYANVTIGAGNQFPYTTSARIPNPM